MAGLDASIYFQQKPLDIMGNVQQGLSIRDGLDARTRRNEADAKQKSLDAAYKAGVVTNPDGSTTVDNNKLLGEIAKVDGKTYMQEKQRITDQETAQAAAKMQKQLQELNVTGQLLGSATDQNTYSQALQKAGQMGIDVSQMPQGFDPGLVKNYQMRTLTAQQQISNQLEKEKLANDASNRRESRDERRFQADSAKAEKNQALETPYGRANTPDDAKQLKEGHLSKKAFDNKLQQMIDLRERNSGGAIFNREDVARGKQLSKDLLLEYKNMAKLGVLSKSDEDIINAIIPEDPLEYNSPLAAVQGQDPTLARMKAFKADSDKNFRDGIAIRTRSGMANGGQAPAGKPQTVTQNGHTYTLNPQTGQYE